MNETNQRFLYYKLLEQTPAVELARRTSTYDVARLRETSSSDHKQAHFDGASQDLVTNDSLESIQNSIRELAAKYGYPKPFEDDRIEGFDREFALLLSAGFKLLPSQAADDRLWNFVTCILLPDIAKWRIPADNWEIEYENWGENPRNRYFKETWWRITTLGTDLNEALLTQEIHELMSRPQYSGNAQIAQCIGYNHLSSLKAYEEKSITRTKALKAVLNELDRWAEIIDFDVLTPEQLNNQVKETFRNT